MQRSTHNRFRSRLRAVALAMLSLAWPVSLLAQTTESVTHGDCAPIINAAPGATVVFHQTCARESNEQLHKIQATAEQTAAGVAKLQAEEESRARQLTALQNDLHSLHATPADEARVDALNAQIEAQTRELEETRAQLKAQQAALDTSKAQEAKLKQVLDFHVQTLRDIEDERLRPDLHHWLGFGAAAAGFGVAAIFGLSSAHMNAELHDDLSGGSSGLTRAEAKQRAGTITTYNTVATVGLFVGIAGALLGLTYLKDVFSGETPGVNEFAISGSATMAVQVNARFGGK
jgi:Spy/CpxP family protein refolding chaperone